MANETGKEIIKNLGAWVTTLLVFALVFWSAGYVFDNFGQASKPATDTAGEVDAYGRSKDIFTAVVAMASIAVGYWFGNRGVAEANTNAQAAREDANAAQKDKDAAQREAQAVVSTAAALLPAGTDIVAAARDQHPEAFGL